MQYKTENFSYDSATGLLTTKTSDVKLTKKQGELLVYFFNNPKTIISKEALMENVWGRIVTGNTIDQVILTLRNYIEDIPSKPQTIVTHFGIGISFEAIIVTTDNRNKLSNQQDTENNTFFSIKNVALMLLPLVAVILYLYNNKEIKIETVENQKILVLPIEFADNAVSEIEESGLKELLKYSFTDSQSDGQLIFDNAHKSTKQSIEKHWRLNQNLIALHSSVIKNGDVYEAVIELSKGLKTIKKTKISASSLSELLNNQVVFIDSMTTHPIDRTSVPQSNQMMIEAMGHKNAGNYDTAISLFEKVLKIQEKNHLARFEIAQTYYLQKKYKKSLAQFQTLKSTTAYQSMAVEIELGITEIQFHNSKYSAIIDNLKNVLANITGINHINKAKIEQKIAKAYLKLGNSTRALEFYKKSIINIDQQLNPLLYAQSYLGQALVLLPSSVNDDTYKIFDKSLSYAKLAGSIHYQLLALNKMSFIAMSRYDWEKAVSLNQQAIKLLELDDNKNETAKGLSTLTNILILQGKFTDAQNVNDRLGRISQETNSDPLRLMFLHFDAIIAMNKFNWVYANQQIEAQMQLAIQTKNYNMLLNNAFTTLELMLLIDNTDGFMQEWHNRSAFIKEQGFSRFQLYMDFYLARYYKKINNDEKAISIINKIIEQAMQSKDYKIMVDTQHVLVEIYLKTDAKRALLILNNLEQYNPHPNPQLELQAMALHELGKNVEALAILNQAKLVYHESWTAKNQILLEALQNSVNKH